MLRRLLSRVGDWLLALAPFAAVLALVVPSPALAQRADAARAALVVFTGGIAPAQLASLAPHQMQLGVLVVGPCVVLVPLA
jgi:hypothetical protein